MIGKTNHNKINQLLTFNPIHSELHLRREATDIDKWLSWYELVPKHKGLYLSTTFVLVKNKIWVFLILAGHFFSFPPKGLIKGLR